MLEGCMVRVVSQPTEARMSKLFSALRIGHLELSHRLVTTMRARPELDVEAYVQRSTVGGLVIAEGCPEQAGDQARWAQISRGIREAGGVAVALAAVGSQHKRAGDV